MRLFCDLDGVLVLQTGRDNFDKMPWMPDGNVLWQFLAPRKPTILSMLRPDIYERCAPQKRAWCARELGPTVPVIIARQQYGKDALAAAHPGAILIDDDPTTHRHGWQKAGGTFIHHLGAEYTIAQLRQLGVN